MGDHRVNDLSYGHLGEATYDREENLWKFQRDDSSAVSVKVLSPFEEALPATLTIPPSDSKRSAQVWKAQEQRLVKKFPELGPAMPLLSRLNREAKTPLPESPPSTLLSFGFATDVDHPSASRNLQILALAGGKAGNVLRLIRPRAEALGWEGHTGIKLRGLNPSASEECSWLGKGGPVQQVTFGVDSNGSTSWLAVRRPENTAILRPGSNRIPLASTIPHDLWTQSLPSRLSPNHMVTVGTEMTGGISHADVSFNPWYLRQFAIIDEAGHWTLWDVEGRHGKRKIVQAIPGKSGYVQDDFNKMDSISGSMGNGWCRILWAADVSTLVVCNRRTISIFDLKGDPSRLSCPAVIDPRSSDWILDIRRSTSKLDELFVLTTTQIFWMKVLTPGGSHLDFEDRTGACVLLSCRHFRDGDDFSLKLEIVPRDDSCLVLLYSGQNELIQTYQFRVSTDGLSTVSCSRSSITMVRPTPPETALGMMQTLCVIPTPYMRTPRISESGPGKDYFESGVQFYQFLALDRNLGQVQCLCSMTFPDLRRSTGCADLDILPPTTKSGRGLNVLSSAVVMEDEFVVPNGFGERDALDYGRRARVRQHLSRRDAAKNTTINGQPLFDLAFGESMQSEPVAEYANKLWQQILDRKSHSSQGHMTLLELIGNDPFTEDIDHVSKVLQELVEAIDQTEDDNGYLKTVVGNLNSSNSPQSVSVIYDQLVDLWVTSLPNSTPGPARLSKERLVRKIAATLYLSTTTLSIHSPSLLPIPTPWQPPPSLEPTTTLSLPVRAKDLSSSSSKPAVPDQAIPMLAEVGGWGGGLRTPEPTPSTASRRSREASVLTTASFSSSTTGTTNAVKGGEDPAITRLRGYALSVKTQPPLDATRSAILAGWPANPGADPDRYVWKDLREGGVDDGDGTDEGGGGGGGGGGGDEDDESGGRGSVKRMERRRRRREEREGKRRRLSDGGGSAAAAGVPMSMSMSQSVGWGAGAGFASQSQSHSQSQNQTQTQTQTQTTMGPSSQFGSFTTTSGLVPMSQPDRGVFGSRRSMAVVKGKGKAKKPQQQKRRKGGF